MFAKLRPGGRSGRPRWRVLIALAVTALALHAWLLQGVAAIALGTGALAPTGITRVQVRTVQALAPQVVAEPVVAVAPIQKPAPAPAARPVRHPRSGQAPPPPAQVPAPIAPEAPLQPEPEPVLAQALPAASAPALAAQPAAAASEPPAAARFTDGETPVYRTVFPPPLTLRYGLQRGLLSGSGELQWRPEGEHYELRLEGKVAGLNVLTQVSQGGFDLAGLAPTRFTDQRLRGATRAANFQRERGEITFSGPSDVLTLLVGAQDRLSWMIQLAAIVSAEPQRAAAGGKVVMYVVGARADGDVWIFRSAGPDTVDTDDGPVSAIKFVREPRRPYDTQVEAWLDPARHHLPVRARLTTGDGDALELLLREMQIPP